MKGRLTPKSNLLKLLDAGTDYAILRQFFDRLNSRPWLQKNK